MFIFFHSHRLFTVKSVQEMDLAPVIATNFMCYKLFLRLSGLSRGASEHLDFENIRKIENFRNYFAFYLVKPFAIFIYFVFYLSKPFYLLKILFILLENFRIYLLILRIFGCPLS